MLREASRDHPQFPRVLYVHPATVPQGEAFFRERDPEARAIADPDHALYQAFGLGHFSLGQLFGLESLRAGARAASKGFLIGKPVGDVRLESGFFLVAKGTILWEYRPRHAGDHPDWSRIPFQTADDGSTPPAPLS